MIIRPFKKDDFPRVKLIYQQGIDTGHATFQTHAKEWSDWNNSLLEKCRLVVEEDGIVVAWAALAAVSSRCVYAGVAEVTIYVSPDAAGKGYGKQLLSALVTESEKEGFWTLQAGIFPENKASIKIHEQCGFRIVGVRERIGKMNGVWRNNLFLERRSQIIN